MQESKFDNLVNQYHRACDTAGHIYEEGEASITPMEVARTLVSRIPKSKLKNPASKFLDPAAGLATFGIVLTEVLLEYHDFDYILDNMVYLSDNDPNKVTLMKRIGFRNVSKEDFLSE
jgi:hypothetical protein